ncbi:hypothetical protein DFQ09_1351, partial [Winogradskyella pacifica]
CVRALNKAIYQAKSIEGLIHHSDRGIQYCSNVYTNILKRKKIDVAKNAINLYNEIRLHLSLDFKTPNMVYKLTA